MNFNISKMVYYGSLFAMELEKLLVNDKITALCQTNMSQSHALYQTLQTTKTENENNCSPFLSSSNLSIPASFCINLLC